MTSTPGIASELARVSDAAEHRGGRVARRADGAYFTDDDVAAHLARRAIGAVLLEAAGMQHELVDELLCAGLDPVEAMLARVVDDEQAHAAVAVRLGTLEVVDPTCGAGSFLCAAWSVMQELASQLGGVELDAARVHGIDLDQGAVDACRRSLQLVTGCEDAGRSIVLGDATSSGVLPAADVVLGNPPFVRASGADPQRDLKTRTVPNRSAWIVERALAASRPGARIAFVLPISTTCTDAFAPARASWNDAASAVLTSHFDTIPSSLFAGVVQRLSIYEARRRDPAASTPTRWYTTRYHRWLRAERSQLLDRVRFVQLPTASIQGSIAKVGSALELELLELLAQQPSAARFHDDVARPDNRVYYKRRWSYYLLFTDFVPGLWDADGTARTPTELKTIDVVGELDARVLLAVYSSSLFWWYFSVFTDNRNVNVRDLAAFPIPDLDPDRRARLAALGADLSDALHACAQVRTCTYRSIGTIRNTYFRQSATRPVLDAIDRELAGAYGMNVEQLEFVLGFERRFRR
jgi:hypothetical protein